jgi:glycosyltransferase involved in cell wall biosynthesis
MNAQVPTEDFENRISKEFTCSQKINELLSEISDGLTNEKIAAIDAAVARRRSKSIPATNSDLDDDHRQTSESITRVCLVTEEIANIGPSGGIGAAFAELAKLLSKDSAFQATILYTNFYAARSEDVKTKLAQFADTTGCNVEVLAPDEYVNPDFQPQHISYAAMRWLQSSATRSRGGHWDYVHFHDYKGIGYFSAVRNRQRPNSIAHKIVVQAHGPSRWAVEANGKFFSSEEQLIVDFMERRSLELCDQVVSPSQYLIDWLNNKGWPLARERHNPAIVLQNLRALVSQEHTNNNHNLSPYAPRCVKEVIYFGRHEGRKGLKTFLSAIAILDKCKQPQPLNITILGGLGDIGETPSLIFLERASRTWTNIRLKLLTDFNRDDALRYLSKEKTTKLVCICSDYENSPYTVVEAAQSGCMLIMSAAGGGKELVENNGFAGCIQMTGAGLADSIKDAIEHPDKYAPQLSKTDTQLKDNWLNFHRQVKEQNRERERNNHLLVGPQLRDIPLVSFIITHFDRPLKLLEAVRSVLLQTYPKIEIIVVDDGTPDDAALDQLKTVVEPLLKLSQGRLIYRKNGYLGAARNTGLEHARGEYIIFMDDDDIAMPTLTSRLVEGVLNNPSDALIPLNTYMPLTHRDAIRNNRFNDLPLPSYIPIGSIASLTPLHNHLGACTSLIRVSALRAIGGYTEQRDVGHEDYEAYVRLYKAGYTVEILPEVLYLYETQRPSMLSNTTLWRNFRRSIEAHGFTQEIEDLLLCIKGKTIDEMRSSRIRWIHNDPSLDELFGVWPSRLESLNWMVNRLEQRDPDSELLKGILRGLNKNSD